MSEIHEETHYQLALTNRQVLTAFVILLGCLFVAFFAGVRIGRSVLSGADNEDFRSGSIARPSLT